MILAYMIEIGIPEIAIVAAGVGLAVGIAIYLSSGGKKEG